MKLTSLTIQPERAYSSLGHDNPLKAVVKLESEKSTVECVLSEDVMHKMLDLCADEIARNAADRVNEFRDAVTAIQGEKHTAMIGSE